MFLFSKRNSKQKLNPSFICGVAGQSQKCTRHVLSFEEKESVMCDIDASLLVRFIAAKHFISERHVHAIRKGRNAIQLSVKLHGHAWISVMRFTLALWINYVARQQNNIQAISATRTKADCSIQFFRFQSTCREVKIVVLYMILL
eukprot:IDg5123t1